MSNLHAVYLNFKFNIFPYITWRTELFIWSICTVFITITLPPCRYTMMISAKKAIAFLSYIVWKRFQLLQVYQDRFKLDKNCTYHTLFHQSHHHNLFHHHNATFRGCNACRMYIQIDYSGIHFELVGFLKIKLWKICFSYSF